MLRTTVLSLLANTELQYELTIVDNNSSQVSRDWIGLVEERHSSINVIWLNENIGGEAINHGLEQAKGDFILISENDLEFLKGWDKNMISQFYAFPDLGQLSPFSPDPMKEIGEIWSKKPYELIFSQGLELRVATQNVGTSCLIRKEVRDAGVRFENIETDSDTIRFPADAKFSADIKNLGYLTAWSSSYQVINWGHIRSTWQSGRDYYQSNWAEKSRSAIDGLEGYEEFRTSLETQIPAMREEILEAKLGEVLQELNIEKNKPLSPTNYSTQTTLFVSTDNNFASNSVSLARANPYQLDFSINFDLEDFGQIDQLRWDPYEGKACQVNIESIYLKDAEGKEILINNDTLLHNGMKQGDSNLVTFDTTDPMFVIPVKGSFSECKINGKWRLSEVAEPESSIRSVVGFDGLETFKMEIEALTEIKEISFYNGHPIHAKKFESLNLTILHANESNLSLKVVKNQPCENLWIEYKLTAPDAKSAIRFGVVTSLNKFVSRRTVQGCRRVFWKLIQHTNSSPHKHYHILPHLLTLDEFNSVLPFNRNQKDGNA